MEARSEDGSPRVDNASMRPGYTVNPEPSITHASAGIVTFLPTAVMRPSSITIVPPEIVSPVPVMMRTLRIAKCGGGVGAWARSRRGAPIMAIRPRPTRPPYDQARDDRRLQKYRMVTSSKNDFGHRLHKTNKKNRPWTGDRPGSLNTLITLRDQQEKG